jgi:Ribulose bisphosphate carboxylase small subunit
MRLTQGTFSFLPDLTDPQITKQIAYCLKNGWVVNVEYTDDPHPRNIYWEMWGLPLFDLKDAATILSEINKCRSTFPNHYIRVNAFDATRDVESIRLSFIVNRPKKEPGFNLICVETRGRTVRYITHTYATDKPSGERYRD